MCADSEKSRIFAGTMKTVELKELSIGYATKGNSKVVAQGLNAAINSGELTCLLGCNGIGKSTLLRTLSAFQPALGGDVMLYNFTTHHPSPITSFTDKELSRMIGIVLTEKPDVRNMTTDDLVGMGRSPYTGFWGTLTGDDSKGIGAANTHHLSRRADGIPRLSEQGRDDATAASSGPRAAKDHLPLYS